MKQFRRLFPQVINKIIANKNKVYHDPNDTTLTADSTIINLVHKHYSLSECLLIVA